MDFHWPSWIYYGFPLIVMEFLWIFIDCHGFLWIFIDRHGFIMDFH